MVRAMIFVALFAIEAMAQTPLIFYCGITMVPATLEAKKNFERTHHCTIQIVQGGSKDLYKSIDATHKGDLFLPGKISYVDQCDHKGNVLYKRLVGYNRLALFTQKNNPKHIRSLRDLLRKDLLITLGNPDTCSIGKAAEATLIRYGGEHYLKQVQNNLGLYAADSRDMNHLLAKRQVDAGLNWVASAQTHEAHNAVTIVPLSDLYAQPEALVISVLRFSAHTQLAKAFVDYLASPEGRAIMQRHGFSHE